MTVISNAASSERLQLPGPLKALLKMLGGQEAVLAISIVVLGLFVGMDNERFFRQRNLLDILQNSSYIAVAAIGVSMVIISKNIDISTGALIGVLATICGQLALHDFPMWLAFLIPVFVGVFIEAINGFFVAYLRIPSIVVTLGMMSVLKGGLIVVTDGEWLYGLPEEFFLAQQRPLGIPVPIYFMVILTILAVLWMRYSPTGRAIYAVGGNSEAARLSGISERAIIMKVFMINGMMVGIASVLFATQFSTIQSTVPPNLEMAIITASVVGGVSIMGGTGTVIGSTLGSILIRTINSGMLFVNVNVYWLQAVQGALILLTVLVDIFRHRRQMKATRR